MVRTAARRLKCLAGRRTRRVMRRIEKTLPSPALTCLGATFWLVVVVVSVVCLGCVRAPDERRRRSSSELFTYESGESGASLLRASLSERALSMHKDEEQEGPSPVRRGIFCSNGPEMMRAGVHCHSDVEKKCIHFFGPTR